MFGGKLHHILRSGNRSQSLGNESSIASSFFETCFLEKRYILIVLEKCGAVPFFQFDGAHCDLAKRVVAVDAEFWANFELSG